MCRDPVILSFNTTEGSRDVGHVSTSKNPTFDDRTVSRTRLTDHLNPSDERELGALALTILGGSTQPSKAQGRPELPGEPQLTHREQPDLIVYRRGDEPPLANAAHRVVICIKARTPGIDGTLTDASPNGVRLLQLVPRLVAKNAFGATTVGEAANSALTLSGYLTEALADHCSSIHLTMGHSPAHSDAHVSGVCLSDHTCVYLIEIPETEGLRTLACPEFLREVAHEESTSLVLAIHYLVNGASLPPRHSPRSLFPPCVTIVGEASGVYLRTNAALAARTEVTILASVHDLYSPGSLLAVEPIIPVSTLSRLMRRVRRVSAVSFLKRMTTAMSG